MDFGCTLPRAAINIMGPGPAPFVRRRNIGGP